MKRHTETPLTYSRSRTGAALASDSRTTAARPRMTIPLWWRSGWSRRRSIVPRVGRQVLSQVFRFGKPLAKLGEGWAAQNRAQLVVAVAVGKKERTGAELVQGGDGLFGVAGRCVGQQLHDPAAVDDALAQAVRTLDGFVHTFQLDQTADEVFFRPVSMPWLSEQVFF